MLSVKQTAELLGISVSLVYDLCKAGVLRHSRHGRPGKRGCIRVSQEAIAAYLKEREVGMEKPPPALQKVQLKNLSLGRVS